ncbi:gliding motility-associated C-terminal domain-containing protein [Ekhidna sp.]|uniref:gliding motility-associated C-terminal domain-containing protein n=1 Tax=Ekhidna sp. TaxID=2608089 RepID=UPI0032975462
MKRFRIILLITFASSTDLSAQDIFTNQNSLVVINAGVPFVVEGSASNSGLILNEGALRLSGDWSNSGDYRSVSGTFTLSGENQIFDPGASTYGHLSINSSGMAVINDLIIGQSLELVNGVVSLTSESKILLSENAFISGGNADAYIDGALFTSTLGNFTFPVGTESEYLPVTLTNIQATDSVGVRAHSSPLAASVSSQIDAFSQSRYWEVIGSPSFTAEAITLPLINENFIENEEEAVIGISSLDQSVLSVLGLPSMEGTLESGFISTSANIPAGYYVLADKSILGPPIKVINVVTSMQDGKHDFLRIENIEFYEDNLVEIFDRQGIKVFEMKGYNNADRVFRGSANVGSRGVLQTGSYYYTVKLTSSKREAGFVYIKN